MSYNLWRSVVNPSRSWLLRESSKMNFIESSMRSAHTGSPVGLRIDKVQPGLTPGRYAPQAPGSSSVSGRNLFFCSLSALSDLKFLTRLIRSYLCFPCLLSEKRYYVNQNGRGLFSLRSQDSASTAFPGPLFRPRSRFFGPESKPLSSFSFRSFTYQHFFAIMVGLALSHLLDFYRYDRERQTIRKNGTQNYRPVKWWLSCRAYIPNFR